MTQRLKIVEAGKDEEEPKPKPTSVSKAFRVVTPYDFSEVYSSDKSLVRSIVIGGDIIDYSSHVSSLADALLLDKPFNHDGLVDNRAEMYIRDIFIDKKGDFIDPVFGATKLKHEAIRLADALELRSLSSNNGINTFHNCKTARLVLIDLDKFFMESCDGYRDYRTNRSGPIHFWQS